MIRLPRLQLFEFNDLDQVPSSVRDTVVESLSRTLAWGRMMDGLVPPFEAFLRAVDATSGAGGGPVELLDLGSGGGGPATLLADALRRAGRTPPRIVLTDLHPRIEIWEGIRAAHPGVIDFVADPVDATQIPEPISAGRPRLLVNVLHHLPPDLAAAVLEDAVRGGRGVFVSEGFVRNPLQFANFAPAGLPALLANPILSPRDRIQKAVLTWLTPIALSLALWDGLVSTLRVYTEEELRAMVAPFGAGWRWDYGTYPYPPLGTGYWFRGLPPECP